jgi:hypothetical protein
VNKEYDRTKTISKAKDVRGTTKTRAILTRARYARDEWDVTVLPKLRWLSHMRSWCLGNTGRSGGAASRYLVGNAQNTCTKAAKKQDEMMKSTSLYPMYYTICYPHSRAIRITILSMQPAVAFYTNLSLHRHVLI